MEEKKNQKKRERRFWEREFKTHEFNSDGIWVPKNFGERKTHKKARKSKREVFSPPGALTPAQLRRSCINRLRAQNKRRAIARWKKKWKYVEPIDLTKAFTE